MKTIIALIFVAFSATAFSGILKINVDSIYYGEEVVDGSDFDGNLKDFVNSVYYESDNSSGVLNYEVTRHNYHFKDAKKIAFYVWNILTSGATTTYPYPCGYALQGNINETGQKNNSSVYTEYAIRGIGDGGRNSCTGGGGPGYWEYKINVTFNPKNQTGSISYIISEE